MPKYGKKMAPKMPKHKMPGGKMMSDAAMKKQMAAKKRGK